MSAPNSEFQHECSMFSLPVTTSFPKAPGYPVLLLVAARARLLHIHMHIYAYIYITINAEITTISLAGLAHVPV